MLLYAFGATMYSCNKTRACNVRGVAATAAAQSNSSFLGAEAQDRRRKNVEIVDAD